MEIKVKVAPLLKALGFKHKEGSLYEILNSVGKVEYEARVYKQGGAERYVEIFRTVYDVDGEVHHREVVVKNLCMDMENTPIKVGFIVHAITDIYLSIPYSKKEFIRVNMNYLLGLTNERVEV